jgi:hypothetical protein
LLSLTQTPVTDIPDPDRAFRREIDDTAVMDLARSLGYPNRAQGELLCYGHRFGSFEGCEMITDEAHCAAFEAILPTDTAWLSPEWDADRWENTADDETDGILFEPTDADQAWLSQHAEGSPLIAYVVAPDDGWKHFERRQGTAD